MTNRANEYPAEVLCPLVDVIIGCGDCIENQDIASGMFSEDCMPNEYRQKPNWKDICLTCKYYEYE